MYLALIGRVVESDDFTDFIVGMYRGGPGCHQMIDTLASRGYSLIRVSYQTPDNDKEITDDYE